MTATATQRRTCKPRQKPERSATLSTTNNGKMVLWLTQGGDARAYILSQVQGYILLGKADNGDGHMEGYQIFFDDYGTTCTCKGFEFRSKCKHVEALQALIAAGKLPSPIVKDQAQTDYEPMPLEDL
ncbi:MAG TPA: SWIM zinc finger family protein [Gemmataceae bacterium]|jgi:hypothetical protein